MAMPGSPKSSAPSFKAAENSAGANIERERDQTGAEDGAENLIEFEGIHRLKAPEEGAGQIATVGPAAADR